MTYTATELFQDWYSEGLKKEIDSEDVNLKRKAVSNILNESDYTFWIDLVKLYYGFLKSDEKNYKLFVDFFKKEDENFPVQNNYNLLQILAGSAIAQKMEQDDGANSYIICLAIITGTFLSRDKQPIIKDLKSRAEEYWIKECENARSVDADFTRDNNYKNIATNKISIPDSQGYNSNYNISDYVRATDTQLQMNAIAGVFTSLKKDLNNILTSNTTVFNALDSISTNFLVMSEEHNVLWWLFGEYSDTIRKSFKEIGIPLICLTAPMDLVKLTQFWPGIGKINRFINRVLLATKEDIPERISFFNLYDNLKDSDMSAYEPTIKDLPVGWEELIPSLHALRCRITHSEGWKSIYNKRLGIEDNIEVSPSFICKQIYQELMLVNIFSNLPEM